ncbi:MAG: hypothetical protein SFV19_15700 [Rhodospirillaceae bacterium]|nr:hypothetical protein [Rhodospirillaceae bacterium]
MRVALVFCLLALPAMAQTLPKTSGDPLQEICSGFLEQNNLTISGDVGRLCSCLVREVKGQLSRAEMESYDRLNAAGRPLPPALQNKITGIAVQCLTAAKQ